MASSFSSWPTRDLQRCGHIGFRLQGCQGFRFLHSHATLSDRSSRYIPSPVLRRPLQKLSVTWQMRGRQDQFQLFTGGSQASQCGLGMCRVDKCNQANWRSAGLAQHEDLGKKHQLAARPRGCGSSPLDRSNSRGKLLRSLQSAGQLRGNEVMM